MSRPLPPFATVTQSELRALWKRHENSDVRRLILEVARYRSVMKEVDAQYKIIHQAWREEQGGNLMALHLLMQIMTTERQRLP